MNIKLLKWCVIFWFSLYHTAWKHGPTHYFYSHHTPSILLLDKCMSTVQLYIINLLQPSKLFTIQKLGYRNHYKYQAMGEMIRGSKPEEPRYLSLLKSVQTGLEYFLVDGTKKRLVWVENSSTSYMHSWRVRGRIYHYFKLISRIGIY
jgi:hypothetical protein